MPNPKLSSYSFFIISQEERAGKENVLGCENSPRGILDKCIGVCYNGANVILEEG